MLARLHNNQLYVDSDKHELVSTDTEFLGFQIEQYGISIENDRKIVISEWPRHTDITERCSFVGLLQFVRRFINDFSRKAAPLTDLTREFGVIDM